MTGTRIIRVVRSRAFIGLSIIVVAFGCLILLNSLEEKLRRMELECAEVQGANNLKIEGLEKKILSQRRQYEQVKASWENQSQKNTDVKDRTLQETNTKLTTLQQHYKLLKDQYNDFKEECSKTTAKNTKTIESLQKMQQKQASSKEKDTEIAMWKEKYENLLKVNQNNPKPVDHEELNVLKQQLDNYKNHCSWQPTKNADVPEKKESLMKNVINDKNSGPKKAFNAQVLIRDNLYEIPIKISNSSHDVVSEKQITTSPGDADNVVDLDKGVQSFNLTGFESSTASLTNKKSLNTTKSNEQQLKLPFGVVPFVGAEYSSMIKSEKKESNVQNIIPNANANKDTDVKNVDSLKEFHNEHGDNDTGAREENDSSYLMVDEPALAKGKSKPDSKIAEGDGSNAHANELKEKVILENNKWNKDLPNVNDYDFQIHNNNNKIALDGNKLKNEVNEDQGKMAYPDDNNYQMEDEDDDEYTDHLARKQQDQAARVRR